MHGSPILTAKHDDLVQVLPRAAVQAAPAAALAGRVAEEAALQAVEAAAQPGASWTHAPAILQWRCAGRGLGRCRDVGAGFLLAVTCRERGAISPQTHVRKCAHRRRRLGRP